jgi:uncharacterized protein YbjT (DUF2867 family)
MGAGRGPVPSNDPQFEGYLRLKGAADANITSRSGLDWTIVRPGRLTDDPGTGRVALAAHTGPGSVPRADVAAALSHLLHVPKTSGLVLELVGGDVPVDEAVQAVAG